MWIGNNQRLSFRDKLILAFTPSHAIVKSEGHIVWYKILRGEMIIVGEKINFIHKNHSENKMCIEDINPFKLIKDFN